MHSRSSGARIPDPIAVPTRRSDSSPAVPATMPKHSANQIAKYIWRRWNRHLPEGVRNRMLDYRKASLARRIDAPPADIAFDANILKSVTSRIESRRCRKDDGMRDYPNTRPHLAMDHLAGLIRWLAAHDLEVMSYRDLAGRLETDASELEFEAWIEAAEARGKGAVLIQYDVDARPDVTERIIETHIETGVPANAMIFNRKIFDWKLKQEGVLEYDEYELDDDLFRRFEAMGGVVGYHCNAFDRAEGDTGRALEIFERDVEELRARFDIRFFSMHGGHVTKDGRCNATLPVKPLLQRLGLTWVHNGHSVLFHSNWADGGASNPKYRRECGDPLDFIMSTGAGERTRLLFHPQYYNDDTNSHFDFPIIQDADWVRTTQDAAEEGGFDGARLWSERSDEAQSSIDEFSRLYEPHGEERPVFINGLSRSGTTLVASMFDAHPDGAMAFESYPRYLHVPSDDGVLKMEEFAYVAQTLMNYEETTAFELLNRPPLLNLMRFAAVTSWTGMTTRETGELLRAYLTKHHRISNGVEALKVVAASARFKAIREKAGFWGTKCQGNFDDYTFLWPRARFVYIVRNGLDILASQKTNGAFNPDPFKLGKQWRDHLANFDRFRAANPGVASTIISYEQLSTETRDRMSAACEEIDLRFDDGMLRQHERESTLTRNPRGQLSAERVKQPIDASAIGRWRGVLSDEEAARFLDGCGGTAQFERFDLEWSR